MIEAINKHMCCTLPIFERLSALSLQNHASEWMKFISDATINVEIIFQLWSPFQSDSLFQYTEFNVISVSY